MWVERDESQINRYHELCHKDLRDMHFPSECFGCGFGSCKLAEHEIVLHKHYIKIVCILCDAAIQSKKKNGTSRKKRGLCGGMFM